MGAGNMSAKRKWGIAAGVAGVAAAAAGAAWWVNRRGGITTPPGSDEDAGGVQPPGAAEWRISVVSITDPAPVGGRARATIRVRNTGTAEGALQVTGATYQGSTVQGTWLSRTVTLSPGESEDLDMQSAGDMAEMFAGQTLQAVFTASDGQEARASFTVERPAPAGPVIKQVTFKYPTGAPLAGDTRTLNVYFYRDGVEIASWARNWVHTVSDSFSQVDGNVVTITHLGRPGDELDGKIESLPLQADQVKIVIYNLPDPTRKPWPVLNGLTVILSDDKGHTLHQAVFNDVAAGRSATHTVNIV